MIELAAGCRRFANTHAETGDGQQAEAPGKGRETRASRPGGKADSEQPGAYPAIDEATERQREECIEEREDGAVEQAEFGIADLEIGADAGREDGEDLPIQQADRLRG